MDVCTWVLALLWGRYSALKQPIEILVSAIPVVDFVSILVTEAKRITLAGYSLFFIHDSSANLRLSMAPGLRLQNGSGILNDSWRVVVWFRAVVLELLGDK